MESHRRRRCCCWGLRPPGEVDAAAVEQAFLSEAVPARSRSREEISDARRARRMRRSASILLSSAALRAGARCWDGLSWGGLPWGGLAWAC